eukprot:scaffold301_cov243-Pinguiococcus_pyrenoidosus.AAC.10
MRSRFARRESFGMTSPEDVETSLTELRFPRPRRCTFWWTPRTPTRTPLRARIPSSRVERVKSPLPDALQPTVVTRGRLGGALPWMLGEDPASILPTTAWRRWEWLLEKGETLPGD